MPDYSAFYEYKHARHIALIRCNAAVERAQADLLEAIAPARATLFLSDGTDADEEAYAEAVAPAFAANSEARWAAEVERDRVIDAARQKWHRAEADAYIE